MGCRAGEGDSSGNNVDALLFPEAVSSSPKDSLDRGFLLANSIDNIIGTNLISTPPDQEAETTLTQSEDEADYCLDTLPLPKIQEGETAAGSAFATDEFDITDVKYGGRYFYCHLTEVKNQYSFVGALREIKQLLCSMDAARVSVNEIEVKPLQESSLVGVEQDLTFILSSACYDTDQVTSMASTIGSGEAKVKVTRNLDQNGWNEVIEFKEFNWLATNTVWKVYSQFGDNHSTFAIHKQPGDREEASEMIVLQSNNEGHLYFERQLVQLTTNDFNGTVTALADSLNPFNHRMKVFIEGELETESNVYKAVRDLKAAWSDITLYTEGSSTLNKAFAYTLRGSSSANFGINNYTCYNQDDVVCSNVSDLASFGTSSTCLPEGSECGLSFINIPAESFSNFGMTAVRESAGYATPQESIDAFDPSIFQTEVNF